MDRRDLIELLKPIIVNDISISKDRIPASVTLIIHLKYSEPYIILTKRSKNLKYHPSQISFPGGVKKDDEEFIDTAIRESYEEIGIRIDKEQIIGMLDTVNTLTSNFSIVPFIAILNKINDMKINNYEIEEIIDAKLTKLLINRKRDERYNDIDTYMYQYEGYLIWGATARILDRIYSVMARMI